VIAGAEFLITYKPTIFDLAGITIKTFPS
jgi:hypothetical protein